MARAFHDLNAHERRRLVLRSTMRVMVNAAVLIGLYAAAPVAGESGVGMVLWLIVSGSAFAGVVVWLVRSILEADYPTLRAVEAFALIAPVTILGFAYTYLSMWHANHANFSEPLSHVGAAYFTVTVLATVGFGDIVARTNGARLVVTLQMLFDLVLVAFIARTLVFAARTGTRQRHSERATGAEHDHEQ